MGPGDQPTTIEARRPLVGGCDVVLRGPRALLSQLEPCLPTVNEDRSRPPRHTFRVHLQYGQPDGGGVEEMEHHGIRILRDGDTLAARAAGASAVMDAEEIEVRIVPGVALAQLHAIFNIVWPFVLPRVGLFHVHAGAVRDPAGRGWLLAGDANIGKSTSTLSLVTAGWWYAADDAVYVERTAEGMFAHGWAEPIRLTARSADALRVSRIDAISRGKTSTMLRDELRARHVSGFCVDRLVFPHLGGGTALSPIRPVESFARLVRASAWVMAQPAVAAEYVACLRALALLPAMTLTLGPELLERPESLARHLEHGVAA